MKIKLSITGLKAADFGVEIGEIVYEGEATAEEVSAVFTAYTGAITSLFAPKCERFHEDGMDAEFDEPRAGGNQWGV